MLLAVSDNGPQMRLHSTREFLAGVHIARHFDDRTPTTDQAWIETLFGYVKGEWPHLEKITDPGDLAAELDRVRGDYNTVRLHASIGYVTPEDEHEGRGDAIRLRGRHGWNESAKNASTTVNVRQENIRARTPNLVWVLIPQDVSSTQTHLTSIRRTYGPTLGCAVRVAQ